MPNLTLQYSANLSAVVPREVVAAINAAAADTAIFDESDIKTRVVPIEHWQIGTSSQARAFAHLVVAMAQRSESEEKRLANALADAMARMIETPPGVSMQLCVEIVHVDTSTYVKRTTGP